MVYYGVGSIGYGNVNTAKNSSQHFTISWRIFGCRGSTTAWLSQGVVCANKIMQATGTCRQTNAPGAVGGRRAASISNEHTSGKVTCTSWMSFHEVLKSAVSLCGCPGILQPKYLGKQNRKATSLAIPDRQTRSKKFAAWPCLCGRVFPAV